MGNHHVKGKHRPKARERRPRVRSCLNKSCGREYQPRRWNQRYCQDPECLREVRRWHAAQRQAKRRKGADAKAEHAKAERDAVSRPSPRPSLIRLLNLRRRVVTQQKLFFSSVMQPAGLPRTPRELAPQPGTLLLPSLSASRAQCSGPGTQVACSRHFGRP